MSENNKTVSFRTTQEMIDAIASGKDKPGDIIRTALTEFFERQKQEPEEEVTPVSPRLPITKKSGRRLVLPVGDVLMRGMSGERTELWWIADEHIPELKSIMAKYKGCELKFGTAGKGADYMPEVITEEWQERKKNGAFTPSCRMDEALIGDRLVWIDIISPERALKSFRSHTDIPCPIRIDVIRYSDDDAYKQACDKGNALFTYYYTHKRPLDINSTTNSVNASYAMSGV